MALHQGVKTGDPLRARVSATAESEGEYCGAKYQRQHGTCSPCLAAVQHFPSTMATGVGVPNSSQHSLPVLPENKANVFVGVSASHESGP